MKRMCFWFKSKGSVRPCSSTPQSSSWELVSSEETTPGAPHQEFWEKNRFIGQDKEPAHSFGWPHTAWEAQGHLSEGPPTCAFLLDKPHKRMWEKSKDQHFCRFCEDKCVHGNQVSGREERLSSYPGNCRVLPSADEALVLPLYMPS